MAEDKMRGHRADKVLVDEEILARTEVIYSDPEADEGLAIVEAAAKARRARNPDRKA